MFVRLAKQVEQTKTDVIYFNGRWRKPKMGGLVTVPMEISPSPSSSIRSRVRQRGKPKSVVAELVGGGVPPEDRVYDGAVQPLHRQRGARQWKADAGGEHRRQRGAEGGLPRQYETHKKESI